MLDIPKRIKLISSLIAQDTEQSLTYAALECRLTLEYLCYERFKFYFSYLSESDLKNWQPKHIIKQISDEIDENVSKEFSISVSAENVDGRVPKTKEEFESLEYTPLGTQSKLNFNKFHQLWNGLSNVALHIPVPSISSSNLNIYGDKEKIRSKVSEVITLLAGMDGNLLMRCTFGEEYSFNCVDCDTKIKRPIKNLQRPSVVSCINPKCQESYVIQKGSDGELAATRSVFKFLCAGCNEYLEVPSRIFRELRLDQQIDISCQTCHSISTVIMRPSVKSNQPVQSHNKPLNCDAAGGAN